MRVELRADTSLVRTLVVLAAISACLVGISSAAGADAQLGRIEVISKGISVRSIDKSPKGPSVGDRTLERTRLFNEVRQWGKPAGAVVGRDQATFTLTSRTTVTVDGVAFLPGGTLVLRGRLRTDPGRQAIVAPVVRGTGDYVGAHGSVRVLQRTNPLRTVNVYTLTYGG
jgi:hypothetical protein